MIPDLDKTRAYAMRLLGFRSHSIAEMQRKMTRRKFSGEAIQQVIQDLRSQGYLNDRRFAQEMAQSLIRRKAVGRYYIIAKLKDHGIEDNVANEILFKELSPEKEKELAKEAALHKVDEFNVKLTYVSLNQKAKIIRFLNNRGFNSDIIREIVDDL